MRTSYISVLWNKICKRMLIFPSSKLENSHNIGFKALTLFLKYPYAIYDYCFILILVPMHINSDIN